MNLNYNLGKSIISVLSILLFLSINPPLNGQNSSDLEQWTKDYVSDLSSSNWIDKMAKYGWDSDYKTHKAFRKAFADLDLEVQEVISDGENVLAIINATAKWVGKFDESLLREAAPTGKRVAWKEVWSFNVIDGNFGDKWEIIQAGHSLMRDAGVNCLPKAKKMEDGDN